MSKQETVVGEPERIVVTRFRCPHCGKTRSSKKAAAEHMARCWYNPTARGCKTCAHYYPGDNGCEGDPYCNCASPEFCNAGVIFPEKGLLIRCDKWEETTDV